MPVKMNFVVAYSMSNKNQFYIFLGKDALHLAAPGTILADSIEMIEIYWMQRLNILLAILLELT